MLLPHPEKDETQDEFIARAMSALADEFEDADQRLAVCKTQWKWNERDQAANPVAPERRVCALAGLRVATEGKKPTIAGHAAVFDTLSEELGGFFGGFREKIAPGAFAKTIAADDIRALWNHEAGQVLGRTTNKTLRLQEDAQGLAVEIDPPDTSLARDALVLIDRGDVSQMSFGFQTITDQWEEDREAKTVTRTLLEVRLFDVSPVTFPAYPTTDVALRSLEVWKQAHAGVRPPEAVTPIALLRRRLDLGQKI